MYAVDSYAGSAASLAILGVFLKILIIVGLISYVLGALQLSSLFKRMGIPTWKAWVPIYASYIKVTNLIPAKGISSFYILLIVLSFIPYMVYILLGVLIALDILAVVMAAKGFNKDWKWVLKTQIPIYGFFLAWKTFRKDEFNYNSIKEDNLIKK